MAKPTTEQSAGPSIDAPSNGEAPAPAGPASPQRGGLVIALGVAAVVLVVDQLTKWWAVDRLDTGVCTPETCIDIIGSLRFRLHYNTGAAFSRGEGMGWLLGSIAVVMTIYLLNMARGSSDRMMSALLGAIAGGAVGNVIDRVVRAENGLLSGGVVDFIDAQFWPIFNIADVAIVCGVVGLLMYQMLSKGGDADPTTERN